MCLSKAEGGRRCPQHAAVSTGLAYLTSSIAYNKAVGAYEGSQAITPEGRNYRTKPHKAAVLCAREALTARINAHRERKGLALASIEDPAVRKLFNRYGLVSEGWVSLHPDLPVADSVVQELIDVTRDRILRTRHLSDRQKKQMRKNLDDLLAKEHRWDGASLLPFIEFMDASSSRSIEGYMKRHFPSKAVSRVKEQEDGLDAFGFRPNGIHVLTGRRYDDKGYDVHGFNQHGRCRWTQDSTGARGQNSAGLRASDEVQVAKDSFGRQAPFHKHDPAKHPNKGDFQAANVILKGKAERQPDGSWSYPIDSAKPDGIAQQHTLADFMLRYRPEYDTNGRLIGAQMGGRQLPYPAAQQLENYLRTTEFHFDGSRVTADRENREILGLMNAWAQKNLLLQGSK